LRELAIVEVDVASYVNSTSSASASPICRKPGPVVPRHEHHGIRRRVHGRYLIFYRIGADYITNLHILNGAMDVEAILFPDG
jgi:plasmid stabilization system protein ParE